MISKYDIGSVKKGQRAEVSIAGKVYPATVSRINHVATEDDSDKAKVAVDVHIDEPDEKLILGSSGAGKSTLLNLLGGMDSPTSGQILINGHDISGFSDDELTAYRVNHGDGSL